MNPEILESNSLVGHLTALRSALLRCLLVTFLLFPVGYWVAPEVITFLVKWSFPENLGGLHYFTPMEVFLTRLELALILALAAAYPWNIIQLWNFLAPALYKRERKLFRLVIVLSSVLFSLSSITSRPSGSSTLPRFLQPLSAYFSILLCFNC